ncbi:RibD family protein, partial [Cryobacterium sp. MLB-32]|uniref:RibD family protein n=1 Tax=Cryobacterium sp. MLB-32 TaxID=1529318 RepID=UPI0018CD6A73
QAALHIDLRDPVRASTGRDRLTLEVQNSVRDRRFLGLLDHLAGIVISAAGAILVGTGTVLADNPSLTARDASGTPLPDQPVPVVIGRRAIPTDAAVHAHPHAPLFFATDDLVAVLADLHARGIRSVFIEGGPTLASAFVAAGLVDEYLVYLAPTLLGGPRLALGDIGVAGIGDQRLLSLHSLDRLGDDILVVARPR